MATLIRRNRYHLLKWLLLVLATSSLLLVWFTVGPNPGDGSANVLKNDGRGAAYSTTGSPLKVALFSRLPYNRSNEKTTASVLKISNRTRTFSSVRPTTLKAKHRQHTVTEQEGQGTATPTSTNNTQRNNRSNPVKQAFHPARRKINSVQDSRVSSKYDTSARGIDRNTTGYVVALEFWDQQTFSVKNILSLQIFAGWLGVGILEPFLMGTKFGLPLSDHEAFYRNGTVSYLAMDDVYNVDQWNLETGGYHYRMSPLTPWRDFLATAPRDVLFINFDRFRRTDIKRDISSYNKTLAKLGFRVVDARYIQSTWGRPLTESDLKAEVYKGGKSPTKFTVIFNCWNRQDIPHVFQSIHFNMLFGKYIVSLEPSRHLINDATQYSLRNPSQSGNYVGVLVRSEWLIMNRGPDHRKDFLNTCLNEAVGWLRSAENKTGVSDVFVGMDIGRFGSTTLRDLRMEYVQRLGEDFLKAAYRDPQLTLKDWENSFTEVSSSSVPGYVAFLQKTLAVHGRCLLLVGFGSFQSHALQMYMRLHRQEDYCYLKTDSQCRVKTVVGFNT